MTSPERDSARSPERQLLRKLNAEFATGLSVRVSEIESAWSATRNGRDAKAFEKLQLQVHRLSGAGATFGYPEISRIALGIEKTFQAVGPVETATAETLEEADRLISLLRLECEASQRREAPDSSEFKLLNLTRGTDPRTLLLVEDEPGVADHLAAQLGSKGYQVTICNSPDDLLAVNERICPAVILMDVIFDSGFLAGPDAVARLQASCADPPPVVFFSSRPDFQARVAAVRAGGAAYFTKPLDIELLTEKLDILTGRRPRRPYRILIVDDDPELAELYSHTLQIAGMEARFCTDPMLVMDELSGLEPDLVLLDHHMPGCSGPELARALRQSDGYESLPIVFLSTETDRERQIRALTAGGDEFLTKPIEPGHLVLAVAARAERGREIQGLLEHDGLTRLLNHASLKRNLEIEVARARRVRRPLALAMIDIDDFKRVNDCLGHAAGDRVLITLANLLSDRLRITDVIGRLGGDELAVIMPTTDQETAMQVLDPIREQFFRLEQLGEYRVTFSCGVADLTHFPNPLELLEAADRALYEAKREGRNRVTKATVGN